ncbi:MAG TPA: ribulose-phosphate 3-epimerase [Firmicutes bacterium]|jgi:ribulose-phosphate 3-epimerase|nr:ribulose-phosphate 3-epimerase [Bacillota bacterium]
MRTPIIAPSLLAADFSILATEIKRVSDAGATYLHFDVMDGHFVDNISFGLPVLQSLATKHHLINDVHIMIDDPRRYAARFVQAGAHIVTFHYEACANERDIKSVIASIVGTGGLPGMSIRPRTSVEVLLPFLKELHLVLIMSVEPGFGGQSFNEEAFERIKYLRKFIDDNGYKTLIEVDGGINATTGPLAVAAGADILVAGTYLFGHDDLDARFKALVAQK